MYVYVRSMFTSHVFVFIRWWKISGIFHNLSFILKQCSGFLVGYNVLFLHVLIWYTKILIKSMITLKYFRAEKIYLIVKSPKFCEVCKGLPIRMTRQIFFKNTQTFFSTQYRKLWDKSHVFFFKWFKIPIHDSSCFYFWEKNPSQLFLLHFSVEKSYLSLYILYYLLEILKSFLQNS